MLRFVTLVVHDGSIKALCYDCSFTHYSTLQLPTSELIDLALTCGTVDIRRCLCIACKTLSPGLL